MKVVIGVSKRHVHLTKETYETLFGNTDLEVRNYIGQPGQFASTNTVDIKWKDKTIEHLRIVGPFRKYDQVEIAQTDADILGVNPPRRRSGDLIGSLPITIVGPKGEVSLTEGLILVERHIHFTPELAEELKVTEGDFMNIIKESKIITDVKVKIETIAALEIHIDTDEEQIYNLHQGEEVEVVKTVE